MSFRPKDLFSRKEPKPVERPQPPTLDDLMGGDSEAPLTEPQRHGLGIEAELARQRVEAARAAAAAREAHDRAAREALDAVWAERQSRRLVRPL